ncbi:MAG: TRAP transporter small permease [Rhodospirillaceae bacterium]|nr:TRAP transporter small permease [Rhodospirillaceae bacterium]
MANSTVRRALEGADRALSRVEALLMPIAAASLIGIMVIMVLDATLRYAFNNPLSWAFEVITMYLMVAAFFFALSHTLRRNEHIFVEFFCFRLRPRARHLVTVLVYLPTIALFSGAFWRSAIVTWDAYAGKEVTAGVVQWPTWTAKIIVPIGLGLLVLRMIHLVCFHLACLGSRSAEFESVYDGPGAAP